MMFLTLDMHLFTKPFLRLPEPEARLSSFRLNPPDVKVTAEVEDDGEVTVEVPGLRVVDPSLDRATKEDTDSVPSSSLSTPAVEMPLSGLNTRSGLEERARRRLIGDLRRWAWLG